MEPIVRAIDLRREFGKLVAVDRLNLEIASGEIFGLVGPDGAGKTTTLRLLCGLLDPTSGEAWVAGHNVARELNAVKDQIGYMAQRFGLYSDLTVQENMDFYADLFGISHSDRAALSAQLLAMTRMEPFRSRPAGKLSGGMKQKLALMCTLLHRPRVLFLDEPTNGVDPVSRRDFWAILYQLVRDGLTLFVTTAYLDEAERCNRVGLMDRGKLVKIDTPVRLRQGGNWYQVTVADRMAATEALRKRPGILSAEPSGATLHVLLADDAAPATIFEPGTFERIEPSLEDVFIATVTQ